MKNPTRKEPSVLELEAALRFLGCTASHAELVSFVTSRHIGPANKSQPIR